jgi:SAM-dependent methyltransferase
MHDTALTIGEIFFRTYLKKNSNPRIVDIGALDVTGSLRDVVPECPHEFIGVDFCPGKGVDVLLSDPYQLPFETGSIDVCVSSSCFEHSEFFWVLFLEIQRILKPEGILYINAPSNGIYHRYPLDCWRFYPDSGIALSNWANRNGYGTILLESFIGRQQKSGWNDFVAVFMKDAAHAHLQNDRILSNYPYFMNGRVFEQPDQILNPCEIAEDQISPTIKILRSLQRRAVRLLS